MDKAWTTRTASEGGEKTYWRNAVCEAIFELDVTISGDDPFSASLLQREAGPISISRIELSHSQHVARTGSAISRSKVNQFELVHFLSGHAELQHMGKLVELKAGDSVLIYSGERYNLRTYGPSSNFSVHVPADWLMCRFPRPELDVARAVSHGSPWGGALGAVLNAVMSGNANGVGNIVSAEQIVGALYLALTPADHEISSHQHKTYVRLLEKLESLAHLPELSALQLASACGFSVRYLHGLFAANGTTFRTELRNIRLNEATRLLKDARFSSLSVAEISRRCGFSEPAYFSRAFRERFHATPASFRPCSAPRAS